MTIGYSAPRTVERTVVRSPMMTGSDGVVRLDGGLPDCAAIGAAAARAAAPNAANVLMRMRDLP